MKKNNLSMFVSTCVPWLPVPAAILGLLIAVQVGRSVRGAEAVQTGQQMANSAEAIGREMSESLQQQANALARMADRWAVSGKPDRVVWEADARNLLEHFESYQAIEWVDPGLFIRWISPEAGNEAAQDLDLSSEPFRNQALLASIASRDTTVSDPVDLVQGGKGFLMYFPIFHQGRFEGFILGVFRFDRLLDPIVAAGRRQGLGIELFDGRKSLYRSVPDTEVQPGLSRQRDFTIFGLTWRVEVVPSVGWLANRDSSVGIVTGVGIVMSLLLTLALYLWIRATENGSELESAHSELTLRAADLARSNQQLEASNQELDDFAYIASHDLKEPLRGLHNYASFVIEDYGEQIGKDGLQKLESQQRLATRMSELLDSLLEFSRVGRVEMGVVETDLDDVVDDVLDSIAINLQEKKVDLRRTTSLPTVLCDGIRVREVFLNLITNAMKYNDKAEPWIEIGAIPGSPWAFYVRDNGIGIAERHMDGVFRIFRRLHSRDAYGGGTGAGLTIVKKIVERHGGRVWIDSTIGGGTTFWFTLEEVVEEAA